MATGSVDNKEGSAVFMVLSENCENHGIESNANIRRYCYRKNVSTRYVSTSLLIQVQSCLQNCSIDLERNNVFCDILNLSVSTSDRREQKLLLEEADKTRDLRSTTHLAQL